jgi:glycosyltransferase involved in cell wall biosynthesis
MLPGHWSHTMGGSQYQAKCIIEELNKTGRYEISYLTRHYDPNCLGNGYKLIPYGYPGAGTKGSHRHIFEAAILPRILKTIDPDIIYQRVGSAQTGIAAHYARKYHCKMVWHIAHEYDLEPARIPLSRLFVYRFLERYLLNYGIRHATDIIAQTEDQNRLLQQNFKRAATAVIPNFHPAPKEVVEKKDPIKVVWVANLKDFKQPEIFIRLADELQHVPNARFQMIGDIQGAASTRKRYLELMDSVPALEYLGAKRQEEVNAILAVSHILVNTSRQEGFPNTYIQAWLRQMPVVSLQVDPDRLIERQQLGVVSGSFELLKRDVTTLITDGPLRNRMGLNAQMFAGQYFSIGNAVKIMHIFENSPPTRL